MTVSTKLSLNYVRIVLFRGNLCQVGKRKGQTELVTEGKPIILQKHQADHRVVQIPIHESRGADCSK